jgi:hypothetical protein
VEQTTWIASAEAMIRTYPLSGSLSCFAASEEVAMDLVVKVTITVKRQYGKFAPKDDLLEQVQEQLPDLVFDLDLTGVGADGESEYEVTNVEVDY